MSRCFPFPPPGYREKARPDDANLLVEEKLKEKKRKKDKKDKDKKEIKEKKDGEKSEEKRREKKEKKDKHKDKKRKERDKEERSTSEQKKVLVTSEQQNGGKPRPIGIHDTDSQKQILLELEKRLRNEDGAKENGWYENNIASDKGGIISQQKFDESKEKLKDKPEDNKMVNGHNLKVVTTGLGAGVILSFIGEEDPKKVVEGCGFVGEEVGDKRKECREKKKHKDTNGKGDKHHDRDQNKQHKSKNKKEKKEKENKERSKDQIRQCTTDTVVFHANGSSHDFNESSWSKGIVGKRKEPETNGVLHESESRSSKKSRPVSVSHQTVENGSRRDTSQNHKVDAEVQLAQSPVGNGHKLSPGNVLRSSISEKSSIVNNHKAQNGLPLMPSCSKLESHKAVMNSTNSRETGDHRLDKNDSFLQPVGETRGRLNCSQPNVTIAVKEEAPFCLPKVDEKKQVVNGRTKTSEPVKGGENFEKEKIVAMDCKVSCSQPVSENQLKSDCSQLHTIHSGVEGEGPLWAPSVDSKKSIANGLMKTQEMKKIKEKVVTQERPPHPDSKYLTQILTVPEVEWSDYDDQAWLFSCDESKEKKPRTDTFQDDGIRLVWAEALAMKSADIVALPYVIPY